jgi:predicted RNA-binding Zn ribbon-like protein
MSADPNGTPHAFELSGGRLCLDFANTASNVRGPHEREHLHGYPDLLSWARQAGVLSEAQCRRLAAEARRRPAEARDAFRQAIELREALYRTFLAFAQDREPPRADLERLSVWLGKALAHRRIARTPGAGCCGFTWEDVPGALDAMLWPVAASAAELLVAGADLPRVRVCGLFASQECGWLFLDETKNRTRRWCSMESCGNRAKARRHYQRTRRPAAG